MSKLTMLNKINGPEPAFDGMMKDCYARAEPS